MFRVSGAGSEGGRRESNERGHDVCGVLCVHCVAALFAATDDDDAG